MNLSRKNKVQGLGTKDSIDLETALNPQGMISADRELFKSLQVNTGRTVEERQTRGSVSQQPCKLHESPTLTVFKDTRVAFRRHSSLRRGQRMRNTRPRPSKSDPNSAGIPQAAQMAVFYGTKQKLLSDFESST